MKTAPRKFVLRFVGGPPSLLGLTLRGPALFACLFVSSPAHADVVLPPPETCFEGTTPSTGHCGPHCSPLLCESDADCTEGSCTELALCTTTIICAGLVSPDEDLSRYERLKATALCPSGECMEGDCTRLKVCVEQQVPPANPSSTNPAPSGTPAPVGSDGTSSDFVSPEPQKRPVAESESKGCTVGPERGGNWSWLAWPLLVSFSWLRRRRQGSWCGRWVLGFWGVTSAGCVLLLTSSALADAIPPDPPCPPGQLEHPGGHQGSRCGAPRCSTHDDCAANQACMKYCSTPANIWGAFPVTTGRCSSDEDCGDDRCVPLYCESGAREPEPSPEASTPGPGAPDEPTAPGEQPSAEGSADDEQAPSNEDESHADPRQRGVNDEETGCAMTNAARTGGNVPWWAAAVWGLAVLKRRRFTTNSCRSGDESR